mmetsp:Transcript_3263/g.13227  ORF Transcript_3263/g.13227 Transcript_3263/m.13227 type:complete len:300 (+) Transcript_3263:337-1236(+)
MRWGRALRRVRRQRQRVAVPQPHAGHPAAGATRRRGAAHRTPAAAVEPPPHASVAPSVRIVLRAGGTHDEVQRPLELDLLMSERVDLPPHRIDDGFLLALERVLYGHLFEHEALALRLEFAHLLLQRALLQLGRRKALHLLLQLRALIDERLHLPARLGDHHLLLGLERVLQVGFGARECLALRLSLALRLQSLILLTRERVELAGERVGEELLLLLDLCHELHLLLLEVDHALHELVCHRLFLLLYAGRDVEGALALAPQLLGMAGRVPALDRERSLLVGKRVLQAEQLLGHQLVVVK